MIDELLQDRAALYVSGAMTEEEREQFELVLVFHEQVREFVDDLQEVGTAIALSDTLPDRAPSADLKDRVLRAAVERSQQAVAEGFVVTGPDRLVQWVNPAFVEMCGYSLEELRGQNLGPLLQGEKTDPNSAARMRTAIHENRGCHEQMINYRKDGSPYWVDIAITPILDDEGGPLYFVARERELDLPLAA